MNDIDWPVLRAYKGKNLRRIRMPLGGIGTGKVSLGVSVEYNAGDVAGLPWANCKCNGAPCRVLAMRFPPAPAH